MKYASLGKMPWDMVVFLTITTAGFGLSLKRLAYPEQTTVAAVSEQAQRSPSAVVISKTSVLDFGCLETLTQKQNRSISERSIRIKGKLCYAGRASDHKFDNLRVRNVTTGDEGTVFFQNGDSSFLTDSLVLHSGRNVVQVQWRDVGGNQDQIVVTEIYGK